MSGKYLDFIDGDIPSEIPQLQDEIKTLKNLLRTQLREVTQLRGAIDTRMRILDEMIVGTADKLIAEKNDSGIADPYVTASEILLELYNHHYKMSKKKNKWYTRAISVRIYTILRHNGYVRDVSQSKSSRCVRYKKVKHGHGNNGKR